MSTQQERKEKLIKTKLEEKKETNSRMICEHRTRKKRKAHKDEIRREERKEKLIKTKLEEKKEKKSS